MMAAFNAVRFRVKPGREHEFLEAHKKVERNWARHQHVNIIKTGDRTYCTIAEWTDMDALAAARPKMIATLNTFRDTLEDLGSGLGLTDPVSGPVVLALK
jgi:antibiotic biosynthesis monooxygenase (ABM) superfamily enzyme